MPWNAVGYFTMWLQTLGFSDVPAATLTALFWGGTALGNLLGGVVGDLLARRLPNSGRQLTCQVSDLPEHRDQKCSPAGIMSCACKDRSDQVPFRESCALAMACVL